MSDVIYDPDFYLPLVATLSVLVPPGDSPLNIILAYRHRNPEDHKFFTALAGAGFVWADIEAADVAVAGGSACADVRLFRLRRSTASATPQNEEEETKKDGARPPKS